MNLLYYLNGYPNRLAAVRLKPSYPFTDQVEFKEITASCMRQGNVEFQIPLPHTRGRYFLEFDLVSEGVAWFETNGSRPVRVAIRVIYYESY